VIVIDASAAVEVLLQSAAGSKIESRIFDPAETLHAPHLIDLEIAQVLRRYLQTKQADEHRCQTALEDWLVFPIRKYAHEPLMARVWELRDNVTAYDAVYIALAEALDAPLLTRDKRLANAPGHKARIELA
jgi:predicted nucleic acid-binding protein